MTNTKANDTGYPIFMPNQVLSSQDLNNIVDYFNSQAFMTRTQLLGQGVVRGMVVSAETIPVQGTVDRHEVIIKISAGVGITTDGQLIVLSNNIQLKYCKTPNAESPNAESPNAEAPPTEASTNSLKSIELFEYLEQERSRFQRSNTELNDLFEHYVLTVVRSQEDTTRSIPLLTYNEMGRDRRFYLRFLLVPKANIKTVSFTNTEASSRAAIAPPMLQRFGYRDDAVKKVTLHTLKTDKAFKANYADRCTTAITTLRASLQQLLNWTKKVPALSNYVSPVTTLDVLEHLQVPTEQPNTPYLIQYFYDYLSLIATACRELVDAVLDVISDRPSTSVLKIEDLSLFLESTYLLLGSLSKPDATTSANELNYFLASDSYRQHFIPQQIEDASMQPQFEQIRYLYARLLRLCEPGSFDLQPNLNNPNAIRITPSGDRTRPLSQQAIPYYLRYATVHPYWNYGAYRSGNTKEHPAYFSQKNHLISQLDTYSVYQIEGYVGRSCQFALEKIDEYQQNYNLAFDILFLKLNATEQPETTEENIEKQHLFQHFAQSHPGMEHLGGVSKGGTFILVYVDQGNADAIIADFSLPYPMGHDTVLLAPPSLTLNILKTTVTEVDSPVEITLSPKTGIVEGKGVKKQDGKFQFNPQILQGKITDKQETIEITGKWGNHIRKQTITVKALTLSVEKTVFVEDEDEIKITLSPEDGTVEGEGVEKKEDTYHFFPARIQRPINRQKEVVITGKWGTHTRSQPLTVYALTLSLEKTSFTEEDDPVEITLFPEDGTVEGRGVIEQAGKFYFQPSQLKGKIKGQEETITITGKWKNWGDRSKNITITVKTFALSLTKTTFTEEDDPTKITFFPENGIAEGRGVEKQGNDYYFNPRKLKGTINHWSDIVITGRWGNYSRTQTITVNALILSIEKAAFLEDSNNAGITLFPEDGIVEGEGIGKEGNQYYFKPANVQKPINGKKNIVITGRWDNVTQTKTITVYAPTLSIEKTSFTEEDDKAEITLFPEDGIVEGRGIIEQAGKFYFQPSQLKGKIKGQEENITITGKWKNWGDRHQDITITVKTFTLSLTKTTFTEEDGPVEIALYPNNGIVEGRGIEKQNDTYYFKPENLKGTINYWSDIVITGRWGDYSRTQNITVDALILSIEKTTFIEDEDKVEITIFPNYGTVEGEGVEKQENKYYLNPVNVQKPINGQKDIVITGRWGDHTRIQRIQINTPTLSIEDDKTIFTEEDDTVEITLFPDYGTAAGRGVKKQAGKFYFQPRQLKGAIDWREDVVITGQWGEHRETKTITVYAQPLAEFTLDDVVSGPDKQGNDIQVTLERTRSSVRLRPRIQEGAFRVFGHLGLRKVDLNYLLQSNPWRLIPQDAPAEITEFIVEYKLNPNWGEHRSFIIVQLPSAESNLQPLEPERDTEIEIEPNIPVIPESPEFNSPSPEPPISESFLKPSALAFSSPVEISSPTFLLEKSQVIAPVLVEASLPEASLPESPPPEASLSESRLLQSPLLELPLPELPLPELSAELLLPDAPFTGNHLELRTNAEINAALSHPIADGKTIAPSPIDAVQEAITPDFEKQTFIPNQSDENSPKLGFWKQTLHLLTRPIGRAHTQP